MSVQKLILNLILLLTLPGLALAQSGQFARRNDNAATVVQSNNGQPSVLSTNQYGVGFVTLTDPTGGSQSVFPVSAANVRGTAGYALAAQFVVSDSIETGSTTTVINATAHGLFIGDIINLRTGTAANLQSWGTICSVTANTFTLCNALAATPANGDAFYAMRPSPLTVTPNNGNATSHSLYVTVDTTGQTAASISLLKPEDSAHASVDAGVAVWGVASTGSAFGGVGDYTPLATNIYGQVQVDINRDYIDNTQLDTSIVKIEDTAHVTADVGVAAWGVFNEGGAISFGASGDYSPFSVNRYGVVQAELNANGAANTLQVPYRFEDSAFADTSAVMIGGGVNNRNRSAFNSTQGDVTPIGTGDYGNVLSTLTYDGSLAGIFSPIRTEDQAFADAEAVVVAGNVALSAIAQSVSASGDVAPAAMDLGNRTITAPAPAGETWSGCGGLLTNVTPVAIKASVASNRIYTTSVTCYNDDDTPTVVELQDGSGGTVLYRGFVSANTISSMMWNQTFPVPLRTTSATGLFAAASTTGASVRCCASGYISTI